MVACWLQTNCCSSVRARMDQSVGTNGGASARRGGVAMRASSAWSGRAAGSSALGMLSPRSPG
eukprot:5943670-Alexandrium_andersonii.AAC.1